MQSGPLRSWISKWDACRQRPIGRGDVRVAQAYKTVIFDAKRSMIGCISRVTGVGRWSLGGGGCHTSSQTSQHTHSNRRTCLQPLHNYHFWREQPGSHCISLYLNGMRDTMLTKCVSAADAKPREMAIRIETLTKCILS